MKLHFRAFEPSFWGCILIHRHNATQSKLYTHLYGMGVMPRQIDIYIISQLYNAINQSSLFLSLY